MLVISVSFLWVFGVFMPIITNSIPLTVQRLDKRCGFIKGGADNGFSQPMSY